MKRHAPATARNSEPIARILECELPETGLVLEIASGSGEHAVYFARRFPGLSWQPTDRDGEALTSVDAYAAGAGLTNLLPALPLDAAGNAWPVRQADAVLCINMVHISPWAATQGLFAGAAQVLGSGAPLILYGPYVEAAIETAASNLVFDAGLRRQNPEWGLRRTEDLDALAAAHGFIRTARAAMPANNLMLVYRRN